MKMLLWSFVVFLFYLSTPAFAEFKVFSDNTLLNQLIAKKASQLKKKSSLDELSLKLQEHLRASGYYTASIKISDKNILIDNPIKWEFLFDGNATFSKYFLKKTISERSKTTSIEAFENELKTNLLKLYKSNGYHFVKVDFSELATESQFVKRILFKIKENKKIKIKSLNLKGSFKPFKRKNLLSLIKKYGGAPLSQGYFSADSLKRALISLKNDFNNQGFFNSSVVASRLRFKNQSSIEIELSIEVNSPTYLNSIDFVGNSSTSKDWLLALLGLAPDEILNLYQLEEGLNLIEDYYLQRGYLRFQIDKENVIDYSEDLKSARLKISLQENEQVLVSSVKVSGLEKTKLYVVLNELIFKKGEVLTASKVKNSIANLQALGIFSDVKIAPLFHKGSSNKRYPIQVTLKERKSGSFIAGFGLSTQLDLTAKTFLGLNYKNLGGTARSFSSRLELRRNLRDIDYLENRLFMSFVEPYFLSKSVNGKINFSRNDEIWDFNAGSPATETSEATPRRVTLIESNRLDFILEKKLTKNITFSLTPLSLDIRREKEIDDGFPEIREFINTVNPSIKFDYRNHPFLPTKGSLTEVFLEYASPFLGSKTESSKGKFDLEYFKLQTAFTFYKPLGRRFIWAQSLRGGYLSNLTGGLFPKSRAFFLGGATTIRGFDPSRGSERIPSDSSINDSLIVGGVDSQTIGGGLFSIPESSHYYLSKSELRFPLQKEGNWWGAVFYDGGSVQIQTVTPALDPWRHAIGLGLRYNTPLGPLFNFEIAYKLDRNTGPGFNESAIQFHLSVSSF